ASAAYGPPFERHLRIGGPALVSLAGPLYTIMIDLKGHCALITGSTKGVGRSIAEAFAAAGANVVIHGRGRDANAEGVLAVCRSRGVKAEFVAADLMGETVSVVDQFFADAMAALPGIDVLVN